MLISILLGILISIAIGFIFKYVLPHPAVPTRDTEIIRALQHSVNNLPNKVFESIIGSVSHQKGKLGELVAYLELKGSYDKLIPLNGIVDYVGLRWPKDNDSGELAFIDVKNGKAARLSPDQRMLSKLIENNCIKFIKIQVSTKEIEDNSSTDTAL